MANVLLFGWFADTAGWREREIAADSLGALRSILAQEYPEIGDALAAGKGRSAVNQSIETGDVALRDGDEVAFFPPVSGG